MQKAEKAGNAMVLQLIAANEEARRDRLVWEKNMCELQNAKEAKRTEKGADDGIFRPIHGAWCLISSLPYATLSTLSSWVLPAL